jgi:hypothetical protein
MKKVNVYLDINEDSILNVQLQRDSTFIVNYPILFEGVYSELGRS